MQVALLVAPRAALAVPAGHCTHEGGLLDREAYEPGPQAQV